MINSAARTLPSQLALCAWLLTTMLVMPASAQSGHRRTQRNQMVERAVVAGGVENLRVIESMRSTARHEFLPKAQRDKAYYDMALPIGGGQTITSAFVVARMTEALDPQPADRVLEIGTGSGFQAAVLSPLVREVYSIEIVPLLARRSKRTLKRLGYDNVHVRGGDGYLGWPEHAPFDKIIVTCSPQEIPEPLVDQLREGGQMIIPLGERYQQTLYRMRKAKGKMEREAIEPTFFVPMTGEAEARRENVTAQEATRIVNGDFEGQGEDGFPDGWYYVRQARIGRGAGGNNVLQLSNQTPGRPAQALQAIGMDGRRVERIEFSARVSGSGIKPGQTSEQTPSIELTFYNAGRSPIGTKVLGRWSKSFESTTVNKSFQVPKNARLSVLMLAMFGAEGEMSIDDVEVKVLSEQE